MTQKSFPWADNNGDRTYSDQDWADFYAALFVNGIFATIGQGLQITQSANKGMRVNVGTGVAIMNGRMFTNTESNDIQIPVASALQDRTDSVVLRADLVDRSIQVFYKQSDLTVTRDDSVYELQLAKITVLKNSTAVTDANITDMRSDSSVAGFTSPYEKLNVGDLEAQYKDLLDIAYQNLQSELNKIIEDSRQSAEEAKTEQENSLQSMYDAFQKWFSSIQTSLGDDVATNLQNQINELKPSVDTGITFNHEFDGYPLVNAWTWEYGLGMVGLGDEPDGLFGGSNVELVNVRVVYLNRESLKILLPDSLQMLNPTVVDQGNGKYLLSQGHRSIGMSIENNGFKG